jgi:hypothetical protein
MGIDSPLIQKRKALPLAKKCEAIESIQELGRQERELPEEYRFILLDDGYEVLQEQCNEKIEETLTYYGEVVSDQQPENQQYNLSRDGSPAPYEATGSNRPDNNQDTDRLNKNNTGFLAPAVLQDSGEATGGYSDEPEDINEEETETPSLPEENIDPEDAENPEETEELPDDEDDENIDEETPDLL